jgi:hypothetical protein
MKIREWKMWTWGIFNLWQIENDIDVINLIGATSMATLAFGLPLVFAGTAINTVLPVFLAVLIPLIVFLAIVVGIPNLGRIHPIYGIKGSGNYYSNYNLRLRAEEYISLPPEDRELYPANILQTLKDSDLTAVQKCDINDSMKEIYNSVVARNKARARLTARHIDVTDLVKQMKTSVYLVKEDIKIYEEIAE